MKIIDITHNLKDDFPVWPNSTSFKLINKANIEEMPYHSSDILLNVHVGTHVDSPLHFLKGGSDISKIKLNKLIGSVLVLDYKDSKPISSETLKMLVGDLKPERILIKTENSNNYVCGKKFEKSFIALSSSASEWLVNNNIKLIGIDGPSVQLFFDDSNLTHEILLKNDVVILEGLNLNNIDPGFYDLICLPLKIVGAEASPCRAILLPIGTINLSFPI